MPTECHRRIPARQCDECPWNRKAPKGAFAPERFEQLRACEDPDGPLFACHKSPEGRDLACAGWMDHQRGEGGHNLNLRLLWIRQGKGVPFPELLGPTYDSYADMEAAHGEAWHLARTLMARTESRDTLQCYVCGDDVIEADEDGMFWEDDDGVCLSCGTISWVAVDHDGEYDDDGAPVAGHATLTSNEDVIDAGQPRCDGSGDCHVDFHGQPCRLQDCERAAGFGPLVQLQIIVLPDLGLKGAGR